MAEQEVSQKDLEAQLAKNDVTVSGEAAEKMKENIQKAGLGQSYLGLGVHDVLIKSVELTESSKGTLGMKFVVENPDGQNDVTMWLSPNALPYTIENVSRLIVHNTPEDKKEAARDHMGTILSAKEVFSLAKQKLTDGQCWLSVSEDPTNTYTDKNGVEKPSWKKNLLSYKPQETATQKAVKAMDGGEPLDPKELPF